jgi:hypothetical protein
MGHGAWGMGMARAWAGCELAGLSLACRLPPFFPFPLFNYAFAVTDVNFEIYMVATFIGVTPATVTPARLAWWDKRRPRLSVGRGRSCWTRTSAHSSRASRRSMARMMWPARKPPKPRFLPHPRAFCLESLPGH